MTETPERCALCGDVFHEEPDTEGWMGLICPGGSATEEQAEQFLLALTQAYASHIANEFDILNDMIAERRRLWYERVRINVPQEQMQADCDFRTRAEVDRQKRDEVWQSEEFWIDPPHLTVPGKVPQGGGLQRPGEINHPEDWSLYCEPEDS